ncbi:MAG: 16S rRNA (cytosine(1402)-N(4))-methyltransferase RsmH [Anaerolineae bacterium]|nr:16S rRNA (cytosine(1402)-N(4))-methyltransferase RsmH [Anaerolineae bacterium]
MMVSSGEAQSPHIPVLYQEILDALQPQPGKRYVDCTLGAGGHAAGLLQASAPSGRLLGLDVDPGALAIAAKKLEAFGRRAHLVQASYTTLSVQLAALGWEHADGILLDLGASSMQFDAPARGFSFMQDGPLDMRFSPEGMLTAADIVNTWEQDELADILFKYGEERRSRQIAGAIIQARPLHTTAQLADVIAKAAKGPKHSRLHPATLSFQALRIAVNAEMQAIESVLPQALAALAPHGRLAVISFHSLEDRIVKHFLRHHSRDQHNPHHPKNPVIEKASIKLINRKPLLPTEEEIRQNPRARSAKLRVAEKL